MHVIVERDRRVVVRCPVEFWRGGALIRTETEDLSEHGVFVRTDVYLPRGQVVDLQFRLSTGTYVRQAACVVHILPAGLARVIGRQPGMGLEFRGALCQELVALMHEADEEVPSNGTRRAPRCSILVADASTPIFERLVTTLGAAGHDVRTASTGIEALESCRRSQPDVVLIDTDIVGMSAWEFIEEIARDPAFAPMRVAVMGAATDDIARLKAYRAGARDFIQKPFTDEEIAIRVALLARRREPSPKHGALTGELSEIGVGVLLSLFDFEHKSGTLSVERDGETTRLFVDAGQIVRIEGGGAREPMDALFEALDWVDGEFEFVAGHVSCENQFNLPSQQLLLEHAQAKDESGRDLDVMFDDVEAGG